MGARKIPAISELRVAGLGSFHRQQHHLAGWSVCGMDECAAVCSLRVCGGWVVVGSSLRLAIRGSGHDSSAADPDTASSVPLLFDRCSTCAQGSTML